MNEEMLREMIVRLRRMAHHAWTESKEYDEKGQRDMSVYKDGLASAYISVVHMLEVALGKENVE